MNVTISALLLSSAMSNSPAFIHRRHSILSIRDSKISRFISPVIYSRDYGKISVFSTQFRNSLAPALVATDEQTIQNQAITATSFFSGRQDIKFVGCLFFYCHNTQSIGGGISVQLVSGKLTIIDSKFERCKCPGGCAGVSAQVGEALITGTCFDLCSAVKIARYSAMCIQTSTMYNVHDPIQINGTVIVKCDSYGDAFCQESGRLISRDWNFTHNKAVIGGVSFSMYAVEQAHIEFSVIGNSTTQSGGLIFSGENTLAFQLQHMHIITCVGFLLKSTAFIAGKGSEISIFDAVILESTFGSGAIAEFEDFTSQIILVNVRSDKEEPQDDRIYKENCSWGHTPKFTRLRVTGVSACDFNIDMWEERVVPFFKTSLGIAIIVITVVFSLTIVLALPFCRNADPVKNGSMTDQSNGSSMFYREHFMADFVK